MARPKASGRKAGPRARKQKRRRIRKIPIGGKTIEQFCNTWGMSRSTYNRAQDDGNGPAIIQPNGHRGRVIITLEAEAEWARRHTKRPAPKAVAPSHRKEAHPD